MFTGQAPRGNRSSALRTGVPADVGSPVHSSSSTRALSALTAVTSATNVRQAQLPATPEAKSTSEDKAKRRASVIGVVKFEYTCTVTPFNCFGRKLVGRDNGVQDQEAHADALQG